MLSHLIYCNIYYYNSASIKGYGSNRKLVLALSPFYLNNLGVLRPGASYECNKRTKFYKCEIKIWDERTGTSLFLICITSVNKKLITFLYSLYMNNK